MRERAIREGSVGLLILLAVALFGGMVLWLRGYDPRRQSYRATFVFTDTLGMQEGTAVRFRGVRVGRVLSIQPGSNQVSVLVEINQPSLLIPSNALITVNQSGLIGDTTIDIIPQATLAEMVTASLTPFKPQCDSQVVICDGDERRGEVGASYEALIRAAEDLARTFADPELAANLTLTLKNASEFAASATVLSGELTRLSQQVQTDLGPLMASATRAADNLDGTLTEFGTTATDISNAANAVGATAAQFEITGTEVNGLISRNRSSLVTTLDSLNRSSVHLETIMATLAPEIQDSQFIANLDRLSADATAAMADIRAITATANTPENLILLQQTLDSARSVFQSAHKVIADVDELTGDPTLRNNFRNLINGLSTLVSLTDQLEQDSRLAQALTLPRDAQVDRLILTPVPPPTAPARPAPTASPAPLLITHNGQYYQLQIQGR
ncbi:MCE family protein [Leptolyngbya sp. BL0902]|nr:MCE family protein [Leptolyngbya sp. BL0902]